MIIIAWIVAYLIGLWISIAIGFFLAPMDFGALFVIPIPPIIWTVAYLLGTIVHLYWH